MILLIGSTGNIGRHVLATLKDMNVAYKEAIYKPKHLNDHTVAFDFLDKKTYVDALKGITKVFFIRPPQIGDPKDIYPFLDACKDHAIEHAVFVSLMGVEKNPIPPHAKIEKYIKKIQLPYTFIRPSFFMENLIYPHGEDIKNLNQIIIPAMGAKTSFIATKDIGEVCATVLSDSETHRQKAYTLTGPEALNYYEVAQLFSKNLKREISYTHPSMRVYQKHMLDQGFDSDYIKITKLLYFMTRLGTAKKVTHSVEKLLKRPATPLDTFIKNHLEIWT